MNSFKAENGKYNGFKKRLIKSYAKITDEKKIDRLKNIEANTLNSNPLAALAQSNTSKRKCISDRWGKCTRIKQYKGYITSL